MFLWAVIPTDILHVLMIGHLWIPSSVRRREEIAAAAWRVIVRDEVAGASVRTVAAEAGLSRRTGPIETEVILLHAVIDGLASHLVWQPAELKPDAARRALVEYLQQMQARLSEG